MIPKRENGWKLIVGSIIKRILVDESDVVSIGRAVAFTLVVVHHGFSYVGLHEVSATSRFELGSDVLRINRLAASLVVFIIVAVGVLS